MARLSPDGKSVTVEAGDTLSQIAKTYLGSANKYKDLATLNNISNPNLICIGQVIKLSGTSGGSSGGGGTPKKDSNKANIVLFGLSSSGDNTLVAAWTWDKAYTANYEIEWKYYTGDRTSEDKAVWLIGDKSTTEEKYSTFSVPERTQQIAFRVKPISKEKETTDSKGKTVKTKYFTAEWTAYQYWNKIVPGEVGAPEVEIKELTLTAELSNLDVSDATHIEFQAVKDNKSVFGSTQKVKINTTSKYASCKWTVVEGAEYTVRCRSYSKRGVAGKWSEFSSSVSTRPTTPNGFTKCIAKSSTIDGSVSAYLEWKAVKTAVAYDIQYATNKKYFDVSDQTTTVSVESVTKWEIFNLAIGTQYFFRLRAKNEADDFSKWSEISEVTLGEPPEAPTTWSSTTTGTVGDPLNLYWVHNSKDGSSQTWAEIAIEFYIDNVRQGEPVYVMQQNSDDINERDKTSSFDLTAYLQKDFPSIYAEGTQIKWYVRTAGVTNECGDWSVVRAIDIYAKPSVALTVNDANGLIGVDRNNVSAYPISVSATTSPSSQAPIGFHLSVISNDIYETVDNLGNDKMVNSGEAIYSKYFDVNTDLSDVIISAGDIDLENGVNYTMLCVASMNSGLTAETSLNFTVAWEDIGYTPNAEITYDPETVITHIHPYCNTYVSTYYKVNKSYNKYILTDEVIDIALGDSVNGVYTTTGEQVSLGYTPISIDESGNVTGGNEVYYYEEQIWTPVEGVLLSVYRREFDGSYTELATDIDNTKNTFITDPHPALDYARYRIVATTQSTGAIGYYDVPGYIIGEKAVIIQWDEEWSTFDVTADDPQEQPAWSGSLLRLPYNIDVSDSYSMDTALVKYIGRKRPVTYYGTQLGETSTWSVAIDKQDEETLYGLRRLAIWPGDVYVREPSGSGYWANVAVSFSQKHLELTIPVTLTITRVEGGI